MSAKVEARRKAESLMDGLLLISDGSGPLLRRDYWAVIHNARVTPPELAELLARDFCAFAPEELVRFSRTGEEADPLDIGCELKVEIRMAGSCGVRVLHRDRNSLTLGTLRGHPEAGRITFGSYRNEDGEVIFHIRSVARSSSALKYAGYRAAGEPMQTNTWTDFIDRMAHTVGDGVIGVIHAETAEIEDDGNGGDPEYACSPTFLAVSE